MNANQFAAQLKETIVGIKANGSENINCDSLIAYLMDVANSPLPIATEADLEKYKAELQLWVEQNKRAHSSDLEMFRAVILAGQNAIKSSFLLNGGAAVAILAFISKLTEFQQNKIPAFSGCLTIFVVGVLIITINSGCTYLSQWFYAGKKPWHQKTGFALNMLSILLGLSSYGLFIRGIYEAYETFKTFV